MRSWPWWLRVVAWGLATAVVGRRERHCNACRPRFGLRALAIAQTGVNAALR